MPKNWVAKRGSRRAAKKGHARSSAMLAKGFDPDLVAEIVGLTAEAVREVSATA